jgi:hypothetical protein
MKYFVKKLNLPLEIQDNIYSFLDYIKCIKNLDKIWYKRLINKNDYYYYSRWCAVGLKKDYFINLCLKREEEGLQILIKQQAFEIIKNIHYSHL